MPFDVTEYSRIIQKLLAQAASFVTITLVDIRGSAPQVVGAKAIVTDSAIEWGTVGGGKIEAAAVEHAQRKLAEEGSGCELVVWNLQTDVGMTCGGEVKLFFEVHTRTTWPIVIYGAGHVAQALVRLMVQLNCHITCIDPRAEWLEKLPDSPKLSKDNASAPFETVASQPGNAFFVLMSKGHATDLPVLAEILRTRSAPYVGVIGSRQKASVLNRELKAQGFSDSDLDAFHCPMGLPIGDNTPGEIAISIAAQLIQVRDQLAKSKT